MAGGKFKNKNDGREFDTFRRNLRMLIDSYGYTMTELSRELDMNTTSISRYFIDRNPDIVSIWRIADHFDVSIDWLIGRSTSRYEALPPKIQKVANLYSAAKDSDKLVVDTLLQKYDVE